MVLFRTILEVEEKYDEFVNSDFVKELPDFVKEFSVSRESLEETFAFLEFCVDEMNDFVRLGFREIKKNRVEYIKASILSVFQSIVSGITNPLTIKAEMKIIGEQIELVQNFCSLEEELLQCVDDSNYQEIFALGSFCYFTYADLKQELLLRQDAVYYNIESGVEDEYHSSTISSVADASFLFFNFVKMKLAKIKNKEVVEKVKKI